MHYGSTYMPLHEGLYICTKAFYITSIMNTSIAHTNACSEQVETIATATFCFPLLFVQAFEPKVDHGQVDYVNLFSNTERSLVTGIS